MQARFYAPWYGRFLSPDPAWDQHFEQTQSWNIYSYVRNNPVMSMDPTGMWEWGTGYIGTRKEFVERREAFVKALADSRASLGNVTDAADRGLMQRSLDAYGSPGDNNGVTVTYQDSATGAPAYVEWTNGTQPFSDPQSNSVLRSDVTVTFNNNSNITLDLPHEGSHIADFQQLGTSVTRTEDPVGDPNNLTNLETETKAYTVSGIAGRAAGIPKVEYRGGTVHDKSWQPAAAAKRKRAEGARKIAEIYENKDKKLYEVKR